MKKNKITIGAAISIGCIIAISFAIRILFFEPKIPSRIDDFKPYISEYTQAAEFYYDDFSKSKAYSLVYSVPSSDNDTEIICYSENYKHECPIPEQVNNSLSQIRDSYYLDKQPLDSIVVYTGFVAFCNNNGRASYVYSINGSKPEHINTPEEDKRVLVYKITDNWYFVTEPEDYLG